jgi:hypothetical protein
LAAKSFKPQKALIFLFNGTYSNVDQAHKGTEGVTESRLPPIGVISLQVIVNARQFQSSLEGATLFQRHLLCLIYDRAEDGGRMKIWHGSLRPLGPQMLCSRTRLNTSGHAKKKCGKARIL